MRKRVYVIGPIVHGDLRANVRQACEAGIALLKAGLAPFVPHGSCYWGQQTYWHEGIMAHVGPEPEVLPAGTVLEDWYAADLPWVDVAEAVLRLPGEGKGSDGEVRRAQELGIPVFYSVEDVVAWAKR